MNLPPLLAFVLLSGSSGAVPPGFPAPASTIEVPRGGLAAAVARLASSAKTPLWAAWTVPAARESHVCCWDGRRGEYPRGRCVLERDNSWTTSDRDRGDAPPLFERTAPGSLVVLVRASDGVPARVRAVSDDCEVDTGGVPLHWLAGVAPDDSVALLASFLAGDSLPGKNKSGALSVLSLHAGDAAAQALVTAAKTNPDSHVRGQALFWLAQRAGVKAAATIENAIRDDPETEVKEKAVFALSQLPSEEAVSRLIHVARTNPNPAVRRKAFFWLGQSRDPRALEYIEKVLLN